MSNFDLDHFLPYQLAVAAEKVSQAFSQFYREAYGLTRAEWRIICHLARAQAGLSIRDLETEVHLEKSKTSRAVSKLQGRGWLKKTPHQDDARLIAICLTEDGQKAYETLAPMAKTYQASIEEKLSHAEYAALTDALKKLAET